MNEKVYKCGTIIHTFGTGKSGAYVTFPYDVPAEFGIKRFVNCNFCFMDTFHKKVANYVL